MNSNKTNYDDLTGKQEKKKEGKNTATESAHHDTVMMTENIQRTEFIERG